MSLLKGQHKIVSDIVIQTSERLVFAIYMACKKLSEMGNMVAETKQVSPISIQQVHEKLGHLSEKATIDAAKALNIPLKKGSMKPCAACAAGKVKQENIKRTTVTKQKFGQ